MGVFVSYLANTGQMTGGPGFQNVAPWAGPLLSTLMPPPCASARALAMLSPIPLPPR